MKLSPFEGFQIEKGIRGKYTARYQDGTNIIKLDDDVRKIFNRYKAVNYALRSLAGIIRQHGKMTRSAHAEFSVCESV